MVREGLETVLFLLSAETTSTSGSSVVIGGLIGLVAAVALGIAIFAGGRKIDIKKFFTVTAVLLILFAAGLAGKSVHEYRLFFGWHKAAENIRVITYFAFLAPTLYFYLRKPVKSAA